MPSILDSANQITTRAALDEVEHDKRAQVALEATAGRTEKTLEVSLQGENGRLSGAAYLKGVFGLTKDYVAGVRGAWRLGKP